MRAMDDASALVATEAPDRPLPKLLEPRQVSLRAFGAVIGVELLAFATWLITDMLFLPCAILFAGLFAWTFIRRGNAHKTITANERARELLDLNRTDEASALLDELLASRSTPANLKPLTAFLRGIVALVKGEHAEARARLRAVLESGWLGNRRTLQSLAPSVYATATLAATLDGDLDAAERWREQGRASAASLDRHWFVADAFLLARRGEWTQLLAALERNWEGIEGTLSGVGIRQLQLLEAYALTRLAEREDNYRGVHSGHEISALLHGVRPGRFDYLAVNWPELREFMEAHGLLASA